MRKSLIISISAALLLCAVLCTAGCVEAPSDPIAGTYVTETDSAVSYAFFENDGTGLFTESAETADAAGVLQGTFDWTAVEPKKTYTLLFADGETETATLDAGRGLLTIGGVEYQKYPSELSGYSGKLPKRHHDETGETEREDAKEWLLFMIKASVEDNGMGLCEALEELIAEAERLEGENPEIGILKNQMTELKGQVLSFVNNQGKRLTDAAKNLDTSPDNQVLFRQQIDELEIQRMNLEEEMGRFTFQADALARQMSELKKMM